MLQWRVWTIEKKHRLSRKIVCIEMPGTFTPDKASVVRAGDHRKTVKRRFVTLFFLMMLAVAFVPPHQNQPILTLSVSAGYNRYYRQGQWVPLRVYLSNGGDDLNGYIRVRTGKSGSLEETTYRTPIDLPNGARKQVFLYVSLDSYVDNVQVEVVDRGGRVVKRDNTALLLARPEDVLYAVVTESPFGSVDLTGLTPGPGQGRQTNWQVDEIPALADALAGLDVFVFHDVDTGSLTAEQQAALKEWVVAGGHLIVAGGDSWQRTTAGLQDLLPVTLRGTLPVDSVTALADYLRLPPDALDEGMTAADSVPDPTAQVLASAGATPLIVRQTVGSGMVDFLAVDPNAEPLRSWPDKEYLWYTLTAATGQRPSWEGGFSYWTAAREATLTTFSNVLPTFFQLCGFLLLYIGLLGPANYAVLRLINRREWAWFTSPALILIFAVLAYQVGFNLRGNVPTVNRLSVVQVWPGTDQAKVNALVGVQSPRRDTYNIAVDRGYVLRALPQTGIGLNVPTTIDEGTRYAAASIPIDAGTIASFATSGYTTAPDLAASAVWHLGDGTQAAHVSGNFTNTLDVPLEDAVLLIRGSAQSLETIAPGQTVTFDIPFPASSDPGPLALGNENRRYLPYSYGSPWLTSSSGPGWCYSYDGLYLTIHDVMLGDRFSCSAHVTDRQQEIRRRYRLLGALIVDTDLSGGRGSSAYLFGWTNQPVVGVDLGDKAQNEEDTTLYIFDLPASVEDTGAQVEVPPGLTTWTLSEANAPDTLSDISPIEAFQISPGEQAVFQFMPTPEVQLETVDELVLKFNGQGVLVVELWNWQQERWEPVALSPDTADTTIARAGRYVGPEDAVNVRVSSTIENAYNRVESITVAYRGRTAR
jgi:hypothetical protein